MLYDVIPYQDKFNVVCCEFLPRINSVLFAVSPYQENSMCLLRVLAEDKLKFVCGVSLPRINSMLSAVSPCSGITSSSNIAD